MWVPCLGLVEGGGLAQLDEEATSDGDGVHVKLGFQLLDTWTHD